MTLFDVNNFSEFVINNPSTFFITCFLLILIGMTLGFTLRMKLESKDEEEEVALHVPPSAKLDQTQKKVDNIQKESEKESEIIALSPVINRIVKEEFNKFSEGQVTFIVAKEMKVGVPEIVKANITKNLSQISEKVENLYLSRNIKVSPSMEVSLKGEKDNFSIQSITNEVQPIIEGQVTTWEWITKPLKIGMQILILTVAVIIEIPPYSDRKYHLTTLEEKIEVKVNPMYFLESHRDRIIAIVGIIVTLLIGVFTIFKK